jgi:hypothetical protein
VANGYWLKELAVSLPRGVPGLGHIGNLEVGGAATGGRNPTGGQAKKF